MLTGDSDGKCYICGGIPTDVHHCMHGTANRRIAEQYGLTVHLCRHCHALVHEGMVGYDEMLKQDAQRDFERSHSRDEWMRLFGKNYL